MNCEDPAKTRADMAKTAAGDSPEVTAAAPQIIPNGNAPSISGSVFRAPLMNSCLRTDNDPSAT